MGKTTQDDKKKIIHDRDLQGVEAALRRAALNARKIAKATKTPLVIYKDGRVILRNVEDEDEKEWELELFGDS